MDAKITKQRLSNFLAYDWLKILAVVAVAVLGMVLIFTMAATNPTNAQTFSVYAYTDLKTGNDFFNLQSALEKNNVFSYDILKIGTESFSDGTYSGAAFTARRSAGEGTVMFASAVDGEGKSTKDTVIYANTHTNIYSGGDDSFGYYDPQYFFEKEIANYLHGFFGDDLKNGTIDKAAVQSRFSERNGKDKRFRTKAQKEAGVEQEEARLIKLRDDYLAVQAAFEAGKYSYMTLNNETGERGTLRWGETCAEGSYVAAVDMSGLRSITELVQCTVDGKATGDGIGLMVFRNNAKKAHDLCFETVSFLNYLVGKYA